ncbi:MAG: hypothetical protein ACREAJ_00365 [Nitrosopumilaceae archaeon]
MTRTKLLVIIIVAVPLGIFTLIGLDFFALNSLQFYLNPYNAKVDVLDLSMDVSVSICNPTFMPTSFNKFITHVYYKSTKLGEFTLWGSDIPSYRSKDLTGRFKFDESAMLKFFLSSLTGQKLPDSNFSEYSMYLKLEKSILGFIPYNYEKQISFDEFGQMMRSKGFNC